MRSSLLFAGALAFITTVLAARPERSVTLTPIGNYRTGVFADGATEIVAFDPLTKRLFSVNAHDKTIEVLSLLDPTAPRLLFSIDLTPFGEGANSVAVKNGLLAAAVEADDKQAPGKLLLFWTWGNCHLIKELEVGALPDMVTFTPNGRYILTANEGEPNGSYTDDPEGSVSIIDLHRGPFFAQVNNATFTSFNSRKDELTANGVRIFGPNATVAQDLEPEYIAVSNDSKTAWVTLQENNAIAVVNIQDATVESILPLGYKDHLLPANKFDASDKDGMIYLFTWPVKGMYLPDAIVSFTVGRNTFLITANEGDARDYKAFSEEQRVKKLDLDPIAFPQGDNLKEDQNIGRLKVTTALGDIDNDGDYDELYAFGGRSFAIWSEEGELVYESGSRLEEITAEYYPDDFNANDDENGSFDGRSDDKGPEPEGIAVAKLWGATYAFIGMERIGGIAIFDISNPRDPVFVDYVNTRDFSGDPENDEAGDLSPEGIIFVPPYHSPTFKPLVIAGYEISGSITVFEVVRKHGGRK